MSRLALLRDQIIAVRKYTARLLEAIDPGDWFRMDQAGVSHVAWQVGHLAMAEYRLALDRVRGQRPEDAALISAQFVQTFGRTSVPNPNPAVYPAVAEIRGVFDRVHQQVLTELATLEPNSLDEPSLQPHGQFTTKGGALSWCAQHEMLHAGQIGLLRRQFGQPPLW
jgi:uncharacterized damage-inducible protein DinB